MTQLKNLTDHTIDLAIALHRIDKQQLKQYNQQIWGQLKITKRRTASPSGSDLTIYQENDNKEKNYCGAAKTTHFQNNQPVHVPTPIDDFIINLDLNFSELKENQIHTNEEGKKFLYITLAVRKDQKGLRAYQRINKENIHLGRVYIHFFRKAVHQMDAAKPEYLKTLEENLGIGTEAPEYNTTQADPAQYQKQQQWSHFDKDGKIQEEPMPEPDSGDDLPF